GVAARVVAGVAGGDERVLREQASCSARKPNRRRATPVGSASHGWCQAPSTTSTRASGITSAARRGAPHLTADRTVSLSFPEASRRSELAFRERPTRKEEAMYASVRH